MGCLLSKYDTCVTHHSKQLYIENEERRFQRACPGYNDTSEMRKKRRNKSEQQFDKDDMARRKFVEGKNISDSNIIKNYKKVTAGM